MTINLHRDFEWDGESTYTYTRETPHGIYRAVVERDTYNDVPPEDDGAFRVWELGDRYNHGEARFTGYGGYGPNVGEAFERAYDSTGSQNDALEIVERWLKVFYDLDLSVMHSSIDQSGPDYIAASDGADNEWQAYIDGDVYSIRVEKACDFDEDGDPADWEEVGDGRIHGFYGDDYAAQAALDELDCTIDYMAADMLPLG